MASRFGDSASRSRPYPSCSGNNANGDVGNFECNICFDLAQDPIVTLCGHLFCWPCLYKWLHIHSRSRECPICKALIEEEKLVPLYGRGKSSSDPRSRSIPGVNIPNRPAGQRPETAPPPEPNQFPHNGFGFMGGLGGFAPMAAARFGNFTLSAAFGGLLPSLFNLQVHGVPDAAMFGPAGFPYGRTKLLRTCAHGLLRLRVGGLVTVHIFESSGLESCQSWFDNKMLLSLVSPWPISAETCRNCCGMWAIIGGHPD
ncbi:hypothetical protein V6N11_021512 [Hibiscus sabdariffa]|uniref:E3 ubiquitin-protein ligase RMA n=1 Tax=Hibiscus sabdariffa TaxID=183260 RepID=A0ABR2NHY7_9ROSI